jgi:RNA polymerase sigma-70 factor, ECF subfamily
MNHAEVFEQHRGRLFGIAYRMLGSVMDAEDILQEAFIRWERRAGRRELGVERQDARDEDSQVEPNVDSPAAYLTTVVTRLCIDYLRSARVQREQYIGPWLPEPVVGGPAGGDPAESIMLAESLSTAFLVLLERLTPRERAAFLLREVFDYDYGEVAQIVGLNEANCRQVVRRARQHLAAGRPRFEAQPDRQMLLAQQFGQAVEQGNLAGLLAVLAADVALYSDGGGKVFAARKPIHGAPMVARFLLGLMRTAPPNVAFQWTTVNGKPGFLTTVGGAIQNVVTLDIAAHQIRGIYIVVNPDKLRAVERRPPGCDRLSHDQMQVRSDGRRLDTTDELSRD